MKPYYWLGLAGLALLVLGVPLWIVAENNFVALALFFFAVLFGGLALLTAVIITVIIKSRGTPRD